MQVPEEKEGVRKAFTEFGKAVAQKVDTEYSRIQSQQN